MKFGWKCKQLRDWYLAKQARSFILICNFEYEMSTCRLQVFDFFICFFFKRAKLISTENHVIKYPICQNCAFSHNRTNILPSFLPEVVSPRVTDFVKSEFLKSRTHMLVSYSKLHKQSFSIALPETGRVVAYISNQISPIRSTQQQQKAINNCCNILKLISKKLDTKLWHNFREILVKTTLKV